MSIRRTIYLRIRWWLGKREVTLWCLRFRKDLAYLLVSDQTDVVIEGYPRSGNSFAEEAFLSAQKDIPVQMASHLHFPGQVARAVRLKKPCMVVIRQPIDAIASLLIYCRENYSTRQAIREYNDFYELVLRKRNAVFIARFEDIRTDFGQVMLQFNDRFGCSFIPFDHTPENEQRCFEHLKRLADEKYGASSDSMMRASTPSPERQLLKEKVLHKLASDSYREELEKAQSIYATLTGPE